jgi:Archaeal flagella assembly protein J
MDMKAENIINSYKSFAYSLFGTRIPEFKALRISLIKTGISESYEIYFSTLILTTIIIIPPVFIGALIFHLFLLKLPLFFSLILSTIVLLIGLGINLFIWIGYPIMLKGVRSSEIDNRLYLILGYAAVLSSSIENIVEVIHELSKIERSKAAKIVFNNFLKYVYAGGMSVIEAFNEAAKRCPSERLSSIFITLASIYSTTGNFRDFFNIEARNALTMKVNKMRRLIAQIAVMAELYVGLVLLGPTLFIIIIALLSGLSYSPFPIPTNLLLALLGLFSVPILSGMFLALLTSTLGSE